MSAFTLKVKGDKKAVRQLKQMRDQVGRIGAEEASRVINQYLIPEIKNQLTRNNSVFTGNLGKSFKIRTVRVTKTTAVVRVFTRSRYAGNVEKGAPPHEPNMRLIRQFVRAKFNIPAFSRKTTAIAEAIRDTLVTTGSTPHPFMEPAVQATKKTMEKAIARRMARRLKNLRGR